jgi:hypothetical protein
MATADIADDEELFLNYRYVFLSAINHVRNH